MVPFEAEFNEASRDRDLARKLRAEAEGILAWAVQGCLAWQRDGLGSCTKVDAATNDYLSEMHPLRGWLDEHCLLDPTAITRAGELWESYSRWCTATTSKRLTAREYGDALRAIGVTQHRDKNGKTWAGLALRDVPGGLLREEEA
jgi:putative DNA primase/helicase